MIPRYAVVPRLYWGFRVIGTAEKHVSVRGAYIDEILMERFMV